MDMTPDLCDLYASEVRLLDLPLSHYGQKAAFVGEVVTVRCYHDNSKVKDMLSQPGHGKVLVVDGHGSCHHALLGDQMALSAVQNGWEGVIVYGAIRDIYTISSMNIGVQALGVCPFKTHQRGAGEINVCLSIKHHLIRPGEYVYADWNGVLFSDKKLSLDGQ